MDDTTSDGDDAEADFTDDADESSPVIEDAVDEAEHAAIDAEEAMSDNEAALAPPPAPTASSTRGQEAPAEERGADEQTARATEAASDDAEASLAPPDAADDTAQERRESRGEGLFATDGQRDPQRQEPDPNRLRDNRFTDYGYRQFIEADVDPLSTFALDVDTGSWTVARRWLTEGVLPPPEAVRAEEFINWFDYDYDRPRRGLDITIDGGPSPFDDDNLLVRVGVAAEVIEDAERPPVALTFIVDTSGSMDRDDRLGLVKDSLEILVDQLEDDDTVALVVYSNSSGVVLEPTPVSERRSILRAIDSLRPGGSTNLESGLVEGYELAASAFRSDGINRVIIASDGVANAGITDPASLSGYIRDWADEDIQLVTVGYGMGNFNDTMMEQLADNGDGFYAYIDNEDEAERLFETELTSTLMTAAIDAKIQVEFDPEIVDEYRLIGFENRGVRDSDFRNDRVDAGELGAGHQVTAMYEVDLRRGVSLDERGDIGEVFLRWQDPETREVIEIDEDIDLRDVTEEWTDTDGDFRLATVVTAFAEVMRDNPYADDIDLDNVLIEAERVADQVDTDAADELVDMLEMAVALSW